MNRQISASQDDVGRSGRRADWRWLLPLAWMALIFWGSAQPDFDFVPELWTPEPVSLLAHATEYGVLAGLLWFAARSTPGLRDRAVVFAFGVAFLYSLSDEFHQTFVPGRVADVRDVAADAIGAGLVLWRLRRRDRKPD